MCNKSFCKCKPDTPLTSLTPCPLGIKSSYKYLICTWCLNKSDPLQIFLQIWHLAPSMTGDWFARRFVRHGLTNLTPYKSKICWGPICKTSGEGHGDRFVKPLLSPYKSKICWGRRANLRFATGDWCTCQVSDLQEDLQEDLMPKQIFDLFGRHLLSP